MTDTSNQTPTPTPISTLLGQLPGQIWAATPKWALQVAGVGLVIAVLGYTFGIGDAWHRIVDASSHKLAKDIEAKPDPYAELIQRAEASASSAERSATSLTKSIRDQATTIFDLSSRLSVQEKRADDLDRRLSHIESVPPATNTIRTITVQAKKVRPAASNEPPIPKPLGDVSP